MNSKFNSIARDNCGTYFFGEGNNRVDIIFSFPSAPIIEDFPIKKITSCQHNFVQIGMIQLRSGDEAQSVQYSCTLCGANKYE